MPAPATVAEFLELLRKSRLVEPAGLDEYLAVNPGPFGAAADLCAKMRADGLLTKFHADQLLRGKHRGFFLGKYKVLDRIGLGGMGQVFLAEHVDMRRRAALKILPPDRVEDRFSRERFLREARAAGQFDHPNLVRAFDVDADNNVLFLVMEYVEGVSFHDLVTKFGPLTPARTAYFLWQAAHGLGYMHARGLIHRDIKPANLLVDRTGTVKVLDLGLVRSQAETDSLTRGEGVRILGTADYLAPEQAIDCSHVDGRADLYGLGATAYFLLTSRPPFGGEKVAQKLIAHQVQPLRPIHQLRPDVPVALSAIISKLLAKKTTDRFQSTDELIAALDPWVVTPPAPPSEQEIPVSVGEPSGHSSAVQIGSSGQRNGLRSGSSPGLTASQSGSAIRYTTESNYRIGSMSDRASAVLTPPPGKAQATVGLPPVLPAAATHAHAEEETLVECIALSRPPVARGRRWATGIAFALTLVIAAWDVAVLTGAVSRPVTTTAQAPRR